MYNILLSLCVIYSILGVAWPLDLKACSMSDPNVKECLRASIADAMTKLSKGNSELDIAPFEPLNVPPLYVEAQPGSVSLAQVYLNIIYKGLSFMTVTDVNVDLNDCGIYVEFLAPVLEANADYEYDGKLWLLEIKAKGKVVRFEENCKLITNITCETYDEGGAKYIRVLGVKITAKPEKVVHQYQVMSEGSPELNEQLNKIGKTLELYEELRPGAEEKLGLFATKVANKVFSKIPIKDIFKD